MKKKLIFLLCALMSIGYSSAQVSRTIEVIPGNLSTLLGTEKNTITDLTLTGTLDASDYAALRSMQALKNLNMHGITNTTIPNNALEYISLNSITLPNNLEKILNWAFRSANISAQIKMPANLNTIGVFAFFEAKIGSFDFSECTNLKSLEAAAFDKTIIGNQTIDLSNCNQINRMQYPFSVQSAKVILPKAMTVLPENAFEKFAGSIVWPNNLKIISSNAFLSCNVQELVLPQTVEQINKEAFRSANIQQTLTMPASLVNIESHAFMYAKISKIDLSQSSKLATIGQYAFDQTNMGDNSIDLSHCTSLKTIGNYCFNKTVIDVIKLPSNLSSIGEYAFESCGTLKEIHSYNQLPPSLGSLVFRHVNKNTCKLIVPREGLNAYITASQWKDFLNGYELESKARFICTTPGELANQLGDDKNTITDLVLCGTIDKRDFTAIQACKLLENLDMEELAIVEGGIPDNGFKNATLTKLKLPRSITSIGQSAFEGAKIAYTLKLPASLGVINFAAFKSASLASIDFSACIALHTFRGRTFDSSTITNKLIDLSACNSIIALGDGPFHNLSVHVVLPDSMKIITKGNFSGFSGTVDLSENITELGEQAFARCQMNKNENHKLKLPSSLKKIGKWAFYDSKINNLDFSNCSGLEVIETEAFLGFVVGNGIIDLSGCTSLKELKPLVFKCTDDFNWGITIQENRHIIFPSHLESITNQVFTKYKGTANLPQNLKRINSAAFEYCDMPEVILPPSLEVLDNRAFIRSKIGNLVFSQSLTTIGDYAFQNARITNLDFSKCRSLKQMGETLFLDAEVYNMNTLDLSQTQLEFIGERSLKSTKYSQIKLPSTIKRISTNAFADCANLEELVVESAIPASLGLDVFTKINKNCVLHVPNSSLASYKAASQWKDFFGPEPLGPNEIKLLYTGKSDYKGNPLVLAEYKGIKIGEYYWITKNFHHELFLNRNNSDDITAKALFNSKRQIDRALDSYHLYPPEDNPYNQKNIDLDKFTYHFGAYYHRWYGDNLSPHDSDVEQMGGQIQEWRNGSWERVSGWELPAKRDFQQLFAMVPMGEGSVKLSVVQIRNSLSVKHGQNYYAHDIPARGGDFWTQQKRDSIFANSCLSTNNWIQNYPDGVEGLKTYWYASGRNLLGFGLMPAGERYPLGQADRPLACDLESFQTGTGWKPFTPEPGDHFQFLHTASFAIRKGGVNFEDAINFHENVKSNKYFTARWCRPIPDSELGYKLYYNNNQNEPNIIRQELTEAIPEGYTVLEKGYLRGFYVQYFLDSEGKLKPNPVHTIKDILLFSRCVEDRTLEDFDKCQISNNPECICDNTRKAVTALAAVNPQIGEMLEDDVSFYPNPVSNKLYIKSQLDLNNATITFFDINGKLVLRKSKTDIHSIDVSNLPEGVYIIRLDMANGKLYTSRIIKK